MSHENNKSIVLDLFDNIHELSDPELLWIHIIQAKYVPWSILTSSAYSFGKVTDGVGVNDNFDLTIGRTEGPYAGSTIILGTSFAPDNDK